jgi:hypothetical protein
MISRCEFRYDTAVLRMDRDLTVDVMREDPSCTVVQGNAGFIAGCLYAED